MFKKHDNLYYAKIREFSNVMGINNIGGCISMNYFGYNEYDTIVCIKKDSVKDIYHPHRKINVIHIPQEEKLALSGDNSLYELDKSSLRKVSEPTISKGKRLIRKK